MPHSFLKSRRWLVAFSVVGIVAIALVIVVVQADPLRSGARRQWKDQAVAKVQQRLGDKAWLGSELARVKTSAAARPYEGGWVGDELLVTKNGQWIVCQSVCSKDQDTSVGKDIFIGHGSDGNWYYSTFHFCVGKCVLQMESQPDTLTQLIDGYSLVPFDGKSDECLKVTWDGGPFGQAKWQSALPSTTSP